MSQRKPKKKFKLTRNQLAALLISAASLASVFIVIGLATGWFGYTIPPKPSAPSDIVEFNIYDGMDFENLTDRYSATAYIYDGDVYGDFDNDSMVYYKSWITGINGSAEDVDIAVGDLEDSYRIDGYVFKFNTSISYYGNFSEFYVFVIGNGRYNIPVYRDPDNTTAVAFDKNMNASNWNVSSEFYLVFAASNRTNAAYYPTWRPDLHDGEMSYFYVNVTFDHEIYIDTINVSRVLKSPYTVDVFNASVTTIYKMGLNNSDYSMIFACQLVNGEYILEFETDPTIANITSITFNYDDYALFTLTP